MIGISKLYCGTIEPSDILRYGKNSARLPSHLLQFSADKRPVVVWNCTNRCNLTCVHCYSRAENKTLQGELSTEEALVLIDDLADFKVPVLLFSGGEPLLRPDIFELIAHAANKGLRAVLSTNGTLITPEVARTLKDLRLSYVGVSLDGLGPTHNAFRGWDQAFDTALAGIRNSMAEGIKVGLRFTINRRNTGEIPGIFDLMERERIPRICFYHLVTTGRAQSLAREDLDSDACRRTVDAIISRTAELHKRGFPAEVLTVDNHADGVYLYQRMRREGNPRAAHVLELLKLNGGNSSGVGIACVDAAGEVHPDQFWRGIALGNVREKKFGELWTDTSTNEFFAKVKEKGKYVKGRCRSCHFLSICNGNFRARAEALTGDAWASDPACYLTDEEIRGDHEEPAPAAATPAAK